MAREAAEAQELDDDKRRDAFARLRRIVRPDRGEAWTARWANRRRFNLHLAAMHVFSGCNRRQISRLARWGDVVEVQPGDVLAREDRSNRWFFVVLSGAVRVTHRGRHVATLHRGGHFGEVAVIGFRPQPATVTAVEPTVLFVLGRRHLVSVASVEGSIQRALFPDLGDADYRAFVRKLHDDGRREWERFTPEPATKEVATQTGPPRPPGRRLTLTEAAEALTRHDTDPATDGARTVVATPASRPLTRAIAALIVVFALLLVGFLYHPPFAVLTGARPIDVVRDITVTGAEVDRPTGRYLLTAVNVDRPHLIGALVAWAGRREVVRVHETARADLSEERQVVRQAFLNSHRQAIALAERSLGVDPKGLTIVIRDRGIGGPSAGLTYALAIIDMLDPADLARGRDIAATGELEPDGRIGAVGYVDMKADVARSARAAIFFVPKAQVSQARDEPLAVVGVTDLKGAVRELKAPRR